MDQEPNIRGQFMHTHAHIPRGKCKKQITTSVNSTSPTKKFFIKL